jgi:hypothetical protein
MRTAAWTDSIRRQKRAQGAIVDAALRPRIEAARWLVLWRESSRKIWRAIVSRGLHSSARSVELPWFVCVFPVLLMRSAHAHGMLLKNEAHNAEEGGVGVPLWQRGAGKSSGGATSALAGPFS